MYVHIVGTLDYVTAWDWKWITYKLVRPINAEMVSTRKIQVL